MYIWIGFVLYNKTANISYTSVSMVDDWRMKWKNKFRSTVMAWLESEFQHFPDRPADSLQYLRQGRPSLARLY